MLGGVQYLAAIHLSYYNTAVHIGVEHVQQQCSNALVYTKGR